jgi:hypothetical protein
MMSVVSHILRVALVASFAIANVAQPAFRSCECAAHEGAKQADSVVKSARGGPTKRPCCAHKGEGAPRAQIPVERPSDSNPDPQGCSGCCAPCCAKLVMNVDAAAVRGFAPAAERMTIVSSERPATFHACDIFHPPRG